MINGESIPLSNRSRAARSGWFSQVVAEHTTLLADYNVSLCRVRAHDTSSIFDYLYWTQLAAYWQSVSDAAAKRRWWHD